MNAEMSQITMSPGLEQRSEWLRAHSRIASVFIAPEAEGGVDALDVERGDHRIRFPATSGHVVNDSLAARSPGFSAGERQ